MKEHHVIRNNRSYTVRLFPSGNAVVFEQAVNPKTGTGWQAARNTQNFFGTNAHSKAMVAWMKAARRQQ